MLGIARMKDDKYRVHYQVGRKYSLTESETLINDFSNLAFCKRRYHRLMIQGSRKVADS